MARNNKLGDALRVARFVWNHPLNQSDRTGGLARLVAWQLTSRLFPHPALVPFVDSTYLVQEAGRTGGTGNWYCGLHEYESMLFVLRFLRQTDIFLDIGANVGSYTVLAAGAVGSKTVSVEPVPATFQRLQRNVSVNGLQGLTTLKMCGVGERPGKLRFTEGLDTRNHVVVGQEAGIEVNVDTIDNLVDSKPITFMKMDIEGYELQALKGASETLANPELRAVLMETNDQGARYGTRVLELVRLMRQYRFSPHVYLPGTNDLSPGTSSENTIFLRDASEARSRLESAPSYQLCNGRI